MTFGADRIEAVDAFRGIAVGGILLVNIGHFAATYLGDPSPAEQGGSLDDAVRFLVALIVEGKAYLLFAFLFGYSFFFQIQAARKEGAGIVGRTRRRLGVLWLIGLLHGLLLFPGDMLTTYGWLGFLLLAARSYSDRRLMIIAGVLIAGTSLLWMWGIGASALAARDRVEEVAIVDALRGSIPAILAQHRETLLGVWVFLLIYQTPPALAMMLLGLIAARHRLLERTDLPFPLKQNVLFWACLAGGPGAVIYALQALDPATALPSMAIGVLTAPVLMAAYVILLLRWFDTERGGKVAKLLAPAGRMALTNYLLQSVVCALVFYGYGLGLIGHLSPLLVELLALGLFAIQIRLSHWWLSRRAYGPVEWLLRWATTLRRPRLHLVEAP